MPTAREIRLLEPGDENVVESFLRAHTDTSMLLRSNLRSAGLVDRGATFQATWVGAFRDGELVSVAAHCWNGVLILQAPEQVDDVAREAVVRSARKLRGLAGPWSQVERASGALAVDRASAAKASPEDLFALDLDHLVLPAVLEHDGVQCRRAIEADLAILPQFRHDYCVEALGSTPGPALLEATRGEMARVVADGSGFVLAVDGEVVAYSGFNARLPDVVQIGGVWTPRGARGRAFARAVVAGSLRAVRNEGVRRAILFTDRHNVAARRAYVAIGFEPIGDYGLVLI